MTYKSAAKLWTKAATKWVCMWLPLWMRFRRIAGGYEIRKWYRRVVR